MRQRRHAADFDEAEAEPQTSGDGLAILVEACRKPHGIGEGEAEGLRGKPRVVDLARTLRRKTQGRDRKAMRMLRVKRREKGFSETKGERHHHGNAVARGTP